MLRKIISTVFIIALIFAIFNIIRQISFALSSGQRLTQAQNNLQALQNQNTQLKNQLNQVESQGFIEKIARNELNFAKPGETVVIIPQDQVDKILGAEKKPVEIILPNWQGWLKLIFH